MKSKHLMLTLILLVFAGLLSGCAAYTPPSGWTGVTVDNGVAYVALNQNVYAVNTSDGTPFRTQYPEKGNGNKVFYAPPVPLQDGSLLVGSYDHYLYLIENGVAPDGQETWAEVWSFETKGQIIDSPLVTERGIFVPSSDHNLYAFDANRNPTWTFNTGGPLWARPGISADGSTVYLSSMDHNLYAISADTGSKLWQADLGGSVVGTPTLSEDGGTLYVGAFSNQMFALDAATGREVWKLPVSGWVWSGPALYEGTLYFGDLNGTLYAVEAASGRVVWERQPDGAGSSLPGMPLVTSEGVFVGTESGNLYALSHDGTPKWGPQQVGGKIFASLVEAGDLILVAPTGTDFHLRAVNKNGVTVWTFPAQN